MPGYSLGRANVLQELCIDEELLPIIPRDVLYHLRQLEILNVVQSNKLCETLTACPKLRSLTVHELVGYSSCLTHSGLQLAPEEQDWHIDLFRAFEPHRLLYILATMPHILPGLTAFKYVQYHSILPMRICELLEAFLSKRPALKMLDINAVLTDIDVARKLLRVARNMRNLTVLGFEYRAARDALSGVQAIMKEIPGSINHLRFAVHGWNLFSSSQSTRISTVDWAISQAVSVRHRLFRRI